MIRPGRWSALMAVVTCLIVVGCSSTAQQPIFQAESATAAPSADPALLQQRKDAGIADCIATPTAVAPVDGGLPELALGCLGGGEGSTLSALRGKPMVINFWAQWCGPCRDEAPMLAAVSTDLAETVQFIGIDTQDPQPAQAIAFAHEAGWTYPQLVDQDNLSKAHGLQPGLPTTLFVSADGRIVHRLPGPAASEAELRAMITKYLGVDA